jgi:thymidylate kinase
VARRAGALRRWRSRRGISVAVVGADGSGKTTLAAGLHRNLPVRSVVIYMGLTGGAIRRAAQLRVPGVVFLATAVVLWARYLRACSHLLRGRIVIFERYVYDGVAPPGRPFRPFERISRRLLRQICPAPDLVLVLDAPGEEMYARKGEYDAATLEQWRGAFRSLSARPNVRIIDASRSADAVRADALALIWAVWSERLRAARSRDRRAS